MSVVFISRIGPPLYSGAGVGAFNYARVLSQKGFRIFYLTARFSKLAPNYEVLEGVQFHRFFVGSTSLFSIMHFYVKCAFWLLRYRKMFKIVHLSNMPKFWLPILIVSKICRKVLISTMTLYGSDDLRAIRGKRFGWVRLLLFNQCDAVLAISMNLLHVSKNYRSKNKFMVHLPYIVDHEIFSPLANKMTHKELRNKYGINIERPTAIFSGAVIERKGVDLLVTAWGHVTKDLPSALLLIVGPRTFSIEYRQTNAGFAKELDNMVTDLGLSTSIIFTGEKSREVAKLLQLADMFVFPSRREGLGLALLEAMSSELPCVICDYPWVPKNLIRHNRTGIIVKPSPTELARAIVQVLSNPEHFREMGEKSRQAIVKEYSQDVIIPRLTEVYRTLLMNDERIDEAKFNNIS